MQNMDRTTDRGVRAVHTENLRANQTVAMHSAIRSSPYHPVSRLQLATRRIHRSRVLQMQVHCMRVMMQVPVRVPHPLSRHPQQHLNLQVSKLFVLAAQTPRVHSTWL